MPESLRSFLLALEDLALGVADAFTRRKCSSCNGRGVHPKAPRGLRICDDCHGVGSFRRLNPDWRIHFMFSNIWQHPKTTILGILTALGTIIPVLSAQGVTLGHIGTGSGLALVSSLAAAIGLAVSKDPGSITIPASSSGSTQKLGCWALIALLLASSAVIVPAAGCNGPLTKAQLEAWAADVDSGVKALLPALSPQASSYLAAFDAAVNGWQGGSAVNDIVSATHALEDALGATNLDSKYVNAADVILNVLDTILVSLPASSTPAVEAHAAAAAPAQRAHVLIHYGSKRAAVHAWQLAVKGTPLEGTKF